MCMCWSRNVSWKQTYVAWQILIVSLVLDSSPAISHVWSGNCTETKLLRFAQELLPCSQSSMLWLAEVGLLLFLRTRKFGSCVRVMWLFSFVVAPSQIHLLPLYSAEQPWYWKKPNLTKSPKWPNYGHFTQQLLKSWPASNILYVSAFLK